MDRKKQRIADDEDEDESIAMETEQPTAANGETSMEAVPSEAVPVPAPAGHSLQEEFSPELLRVYYARCFPAELMCRWLGYGTEGERDTSKALLGRREISFTTGDDVYIRYLSYDDAAGLRKDLINKMPYKIDIGAIFSAAPRDHKKYKLFEPQQREFIIDIDLTDYDFLEVDVKRLETCDRCWPLMALAMRVLGHAMREDFGFEHLLYVYSGRRGIHIWCCDKRARQMSNEVRSAVADYLGPRLDPATGRLKISTPMHPALMRAYEEELVPFFNATMLKADALGGFGILDTVERQKLLLDMLQDESVSTKLSDDWTRKSHYTGEQRWAALTKLVRDQKKPKLSAAVTEIIFTYTYPRLDVNVSKGMNHLLKSPWCAHPKTGRVCVPVDLDKADDFDPSAVPTLRMVAEDLDVAAKEGRTGDKPITLTRLAKYEAAFDDFLQKCDSSSRSDAAREKAAEKESSLAF